MRETVTDDGVGVGLRGQRRRRPHFHKTQTIYVHHIRYCFYKRQRYKRTVVSKLYHVCLLLLACVNEGNKPWKMYRTMYGNLLHMFHTLNSQVYICTFDCLCEVIYIRCIITKMIICNVSNKYESSLRFVLYNQYLHHQTQCIKPTVTHIHMYVYIY